MLNHTKILIRNFSLIINLFFISIHFSISQETEFKSRLLIKELPNEKDIKKKSQTDLESSDIIKNKVKIKKDKKIKLNKSNNKKKLENNKFKIFYKANEVKPADKDLDYILNSFSNYNKDKKINILAFASKGANKTSSDARRLSLSRALLLRKLFINNKFLSTNIYVRAMGSELNKEESQDIVIIETK